MSTGIYRTSRGTIVDMNKLASKNELTPAVGNMNVNARGDKLGMGGKIIHSSEGTQMVPDEIRKPDVQQAPLTVEEKNKNIQDMDPEGDE